MTRLPESPAEFFTDYLPARYAPMKEGLRGKTSVGSMVFHITGPEGNASWSVRLADGDLQVTSGAAADPIVQITTSSEDFRHLMLQAVRIGDEQLGKAEAQLLAFKALTLDAERLTLARSVKGSVAFVVTDGGVKRRITLTPGDGVPNLDKPECRLECQASDFLDLQLGKQLPIQLAMSGKMRIIGDAQIPMAMNAVLA